MVVAHEILVTAQRPNSFFPIFGFDLGLDFGLGLGLGHVNFPDKNAGLFDLCRNGLN